MNREMATKNYMDAMVTFGPVLPASDTPPTNPEDGSIWFDTSPGGDHVLVYNGTEAAWVPLAVEANLEPLVQRLGSHEAEKVLTEEIVERHLRAEDEELDRLWKEYKTLARLKADYKKDLDKLLEE